MKEYDYCLKCGKKEFDFISGRKWICRSCGYSIYFNTAGAAAAIIKYKGCILLTEREKNPGAGLLDLPGGFIDFDESAESALSREIKEELGLRISPDNWKYLCSQANHYPYKEVDYRTIDLFYMTSIDKKEINPDTKEIRNYHWLPEEEIITKLDSIAFASVRSTLKLYLSLNPRD